MLLHVLSFTSTTSWPCCDLLHWGYSAVLGLAGEFRIVRTGTDLWGLGLRSLERRAIAASSLAAPISAAPRTSSRRCLDALTVLRGRRFLPTSRPPLSQPSASGAVTAIADVLVASQRTRWPWPEETALRFGVRELPSTAHQQRRTP